MEDYHVRSLISKYPELVHPFCLSRSEEKPSILHVKLLFSSISEEAAAPPACAAGLDGIAATFADFWFLPWFDRPEWKPQSIYTLTDRTKRISISRK